MNFRRVVEIFSVVAVIFSFTACGDDKSSSANSLPDEVADKAELNTYECDMSIIGKKVFVNDLDKLYECDGDHWFVSYDQPKSSAKSKSSSSSSKKRSSSSSKSSSSSTKQSSSSSSKKLQSSSSGKSSSSFNELIEDEGTDWIDGKYFLPAGTFDCSEFKCGEKVNLKVYAEFMDGRDGNVYKVARAANRIWFAEKLRYRLDDTLYNEKKDMVYTWCTMMKLDSTKCGTDFLSNVSDENRQGLCPNGWHIPNVDELTDLYNYYAEDEANKKRCVGVFYNDVFLTSTEYDNKYCWTLNANCRFGYNLDSLLRKNSYSKNSRLGVRCVKDDDEILKGKVECNEKNAGIASVDSKGNIVQCRNNKWVNNPYHYFTDSRDGQIYRKVKIGNQWWMAENLNYKTDKSMCASCHLVGRIYPWSDAMDSAGVYSLSGVMCGALEYRENYLCKPVYPVRGICPEGWHLPTKDEFEILIESVGGVDSAGIVLKDSSSIYWWKNEIPGVDAYGFTARGGAYFLSDYGSSGTLFGERKASYMWTSSSDEGAYKAYFFILSHDSKSMGYATTDFKDRKYAIRCVMDE